jgi:Bacterial PH domain
MSHDDFDFEPIRGLPAVLPDGEKLLWQGSPNWRSLAVRAYHVRKVAIYFCAIIAWRIAIGIRNGDAPSAMVVSCAFIFSLGCVAMGVLSLLAFLNGRSTVYSITTRRVLLRHGVAVPMTMNIPLKLIESADFKRYSDGTGEISLTVPREHRVGYMITWPHLRPGQYTRPRPSFRALPDAKRTAELLSAALAAEAGLSAQRIAAVQNETSNFAPHTAVA